MKASKLSAAQIAFVQKQAEEEHRGCGGLPPYRDCGGYLLQLAQALCRADAL